MVSKPSDKDPMTNDSNKLTTKRTVHSWADLGRNGLSWVGSVLPWAGMSQDEPNEVDWTSVG